MSYNSLKILIIVFLLNSCATYKKQSSVELLDFENLKKTPSHTFYLAGGIGNLNDVKNSELLTDLKSELENADNNTTLLFTGDNISENENNWEEDKRLINAQISLTQNFKGKTIFIPGNNEWKSYNTRKVEKVEKYLKDLKNENINFFPENVCPVEHQVINDDLDLILIDSKWFISNWSRLEGINKKCTSITTRRRFLEEVEGYINDAQGKNIVIAMHHPIFSNGKFAGKETFKEQMKPAPIVGSLINKVEDLGAFSTNRLNSRRYRYLRILLSALAKSSDRITVVSGHEESLQYLSGGGIHQVIAGSISNNTATKLTEDKISTIGGSLDYKGNFSYGQKGFAKLVYYEDGSSNVTFFTNNENKNTVAILPNLKKDTTTVSYTKTSQKNFTTSILHDKDDLYKSDSYKFLWGERYRSYFGKPVTSKVALLDTLYGGLKVTKKGGGHQSYSIRLEDENGKEYSMRSLRKNALKFLKFKIKGIAFTENDYQDTWTEGAISDFFTTAHPYMQLAINPLARAVDINHSSPELFYVPKQERLGDLNSEFGDELYFIEERPSDEQLNYKGYKRVIDEAGKIKDFESTTDMLEKIKSDESYSVDQRAFIRARIFDMLIGDWDRHQDQWRWVEYETKDGDKEFQPVPRDRDNAFPKFDGFAMKAIKLFVPDSRRWQTYGPEIQNVKWLNIGGNRIDRAVLTKYDEKVWAEEAMFIKENLTDDIIENAFNNLPKEVHDENSNKVKENLKKRLESIVDDAKEYSQYLDNIVTLHGTEKDDKIEITRLADGKTKVVIKRLLSDAVDEITFERTFNKKDTKEIWIYGLGDDDIFEVTGDAKKSIFIRLIGGYGEDSFSVKNKSRIKVYDWQHEKISFEEKNVSKQLTDIYNTNTYHWRFFEENSNILVPNIGFRTDDGFYLGATNSYTNNGFNGNSFRQKHTIAANYYFKFKAAEVFYNGEFANIFPGWNFEINAYHTNDKFSNNFFGLGNETVNLEDNLTRDFYRARIQKTRVDAGIAFHTLKVKALYESFKVKEMEDRFFNTNNFAPEVFETQNYIGAETEALYDNADAKDFPSKSIVFGLKAGYKINPSINENKFGYLKFKAGFSHKLTSSGNLVFSTLGEVRTNFGDNYFFYHAPSIGGSNGLRGFRDERFSGKTYFYQTSDVRLRLKRYITAVAPITVGMYGGFDYGKVWNNNEDSTKWHTSQGIGLWASGFDFLSLNIGYFNSVESNIFQVGFGFQF